MSFQDFQDGHHGGHLGYWNRTNLAILNLQCLPQSLGSIWLTVLEQMWFEDFQDGNRGGHIGYRNGTILAILKLCVAPMPPIKFWLNPTWFGRKVVWRYSRLTTWGPSWISEWNSFRNSKSPCLGAIWLRVREQMWFQDFQDGSPGSHLG